MLYHIALCQELVLHIYNSSNQEPIENVFLYTKDESINKISKKDGSLTISISRNEIIYLSHSSFKKAKFSYEEIVQSDFKIFLEPLDIHLEEIIVKVNKWEENEKDIPNTIQYIDEKKIHFSNPQTSADCIRL